MKIWGLLFLLFLISCDSDDSEYGSSYSSSDEEISGCKYSDGYHSATVDYYNPETGTSRTYDLEVVVKDCSVVQIDFPKGGWLDESHIDAGEIDDNGNAEIEDDRGRQFSVQIDD
jgi:hypothetical protein